MKKKKSFLKHYNTFFEKIYRYVFFRAGRNRELAEDMTSEIFLKAYEAYENFDGQKNFGVWIYRIAHNHLIDYYRRAKPEHVPIENVEQELGVNAGHPQEVDKNLDLAHLSNVLTVLPESQRDVVVMKFFNDLSTQEIAEVMNTTEAHVRVLQHRAIDFLKTRLSFLTP